MRDAVNSDTPISATSALILERLPRVKSRTGLSRSEIYRRCATNPPSFPRPVKLGEHASAWVSVEIDQFIIDRIAERDANADHNPKVWIARCPAHAGMTASLAVSEGKGKGGKPLPNCFGVCDE